MAKYGNDLCTKVELMLSARSLADKDVFSKSDPICIVYELRYDPRQLQRGAELDAKTYVEVGRTARISNSLNPNWNEKICLNYYFESKQVLKFEVYDVDSASQQLSDHDFLGSCTCQLADVVAAQNGTLVLKLSSSRLKGNLIVRADELDEGQKETVFFVCHGRSLDKKSILYKCDPFLEFYRLMPDGSRQMVHRTEVVKKTQNPEWKPFELLVRHLCQGEKDREFLIECYDFLGNGSHKLIGAVRTTVNKITELPTANLTLINAKKERKKGSSYKGSGVLHFLNVELRKEFSFLDFIGAGLQLDFGVSIDFTASNGPVHSLTSLHHINTAPGALNQYEAAVYAVLDICQCYNRTKRFEVTGFGAKIPPQNVVSHVFPLNFNDFSREVEGVEGVLSAYRTSLHQIQLYGPTNFAPTIRDYTFKLRRLSKTSGRYQILLIITDGVITDMERTKSAIVEASDLPLSIIIVGVGMDNFSKMDALDSDNQLMRSVEGNVAKRDIVQFVAMNKFFRAQAIPKDYREYAFIQSALAKELLAEVPLQITSYMKSFGITPSMLESWNSDSTNGGEPNGAIGFNPTSGGMNNTGLPADHQFFPAGNPAGFAAQPPTADARNDSTRLANFDPANPANLPMPQRQLPLYPEVKYPPEASAQYSQQAYPSSNQTQFNLNASAPPIDNY